MKSNVCQEYDQVGLPAFAAAICLDGALTAGLGQSLDGLSVWPSKAFCRKQKVA